MFIQNILGCYLKNCCFKINLNLILKYLNLKEHCPEDNQFIADSSKEKSMYYFCVDDKDKIPYLKRDKSFFQKQIFTKKVSPQKHWGMNKWTEGLC